MSVRVSVAEARRRGWLDTPAPRTRRAPVPRVPVRAYAVCAPVARCRQCQAWLTAQQARRPVAQHAIWTEEEKTP